MAKQNPANPNSPISKKKPPAKDNKNRHPNPFIVLNDLSIQM